MLGLVLAGITLLMFRGALQLSFDDDYKSIFRSQHEDFVHLEQFLQHFPGDENDLLLVFQAKDILAPATLSALRMIIEQVEDISLVESAFSIFSLPGQGSSIRAIKPLIPKTSELSHAHGVMVDRVIAHPLVHGRLLSADRTTTLAVVRLAHHDGDISRIDAVLAGVHGLVRELAGESDIRLRITGNPAVRVAMRNQSIHDQIVFNGLGGLLASLIAFIVFRSLLITWIVSTGPVIGVVWTLGAMGYADAEINVINQMIPPLVMVIGFTDAVHLMFAMQRARTSGVSARRASLVAVQTVGLACLLTSVTTAIGFGSLLFASTSVIQELALFAAIGTLATLAAVILFVPLAGSFLADHVVRKTHRLDEALLQTRWYCRPLEIILAHPRPVVVVAGVATAFAVYTALQLETDFRFRENLPRGHEVAEGFRIGDRALGGVQPLHLVIDWPQARKFSDPLVLQAIQEAQALLTSEPMTGNTLSILDVLRLLPGTEETLIDRIPRLIYVADGIVEQLLNKRQRMALVTARIADVGAKAQLPALEQLEGKLSELRARHPGFGFQLTSIALSAARGSTEMIGDLLRSLTWAVCLIFALLALALGSLRLGMISCLANILPLAAIAAALVLSGQPLQYASIMAFTICLGIIVDDTIHFLVRYRRARTSTADVAAAVGQAHQAVGPVLITTTLILLAGFGTMMTSATEVVVRMGMLSCLALLIALLADLVVLPALLLIFYDRAKTERVRRGR